MKNLSDNIKSAVVMAAMLFLVLAAFVAVVAPPLLRFATDRLETELHEHANIGAHALQAEHTRQIFMHLSAINTELRRINPNYIPPVFAVPADTIVVDSLRIEPPSR